MTAGGILAAAALGVLGIGMMVSGAALVFDGIRVALAFATASMVAAVVFLGLALMTVPPGPTWDDSACAFEDCTCQCPAPGLPIQEDGIVVCGCAEPEPEQPGGTCAWTVKQARIFNLPLCYEM